MTYPYQDMSFNGLGGTSTISSFTIDTLGGNVVQTYHSGPTPPSECSEGCILDASRVRILFWPVDESNSAVHNASNTPIPSLYTTVTDGFTLYVVIIFVCAAVL